MAVDRRTLLLSVVAALAVSLAGLAAVADLGAPPGQWLIPEKQAEGDEDTSRAAHAASPIAPRGLDPYAPPALSHAHALPAGDGAVPTRAEAMEFAKRYSSFRAKGDDGLDRLVEQGHLKGSGTRADPYILERFYVDGDLRLESAGKAIILREGYVSGQLRLNYIGSDVLVHHVYAKDLRVNENVERKGDDTGGLFHGNQFGFIGQLRHFSGEFRDNLVGPRPQNVATSYLGDAGLTELAEGIVFNFDGFHGARVHSNTIVGAVDIKIHGHYHGDCLTCTPHDHADETDFPGAAGHAEGADHDAHGAHGHDEPSSAERKWLEEKGMRSHHSVRYHSLHFFDNEIEVEDGYALRYYDRAHRADDETANSEPNPYLKDNHVHYQFVWIEGNSLKGGHMMLDVFNAGDDRHVVPNQGVLRVDGNVVHVAYMQTTQPVPFALGFDLLKAEGITLLLSANAVRFEEVEDGSPMGLLPGAMKRAPERIGIRLNNLDHGNVTIDGNTVKDADVGVVAAKLGPLLWWDLTGNTFQAVEDVRTHDIANPPGAGPEDGPEDGGEGEPDPHAGHGHHGGGG